MTTTIESRHETPIWLRSGDDDLMAVMTQPEVPSELGVLLLTGGGWMPSTHRNRMYVDLARHLASLGCTVARFDYPGVGDSTGETPVFDSMRPHVEATLAAVDALRTSGSKRIVMVGTCYGGRTAIAAAGGVPDLAGLVLSGVPVKDYGAADKSLAWHIRKAWSRETLKNLRSRYQKYLRILRNRVGRLLQSGRSSSRDPVSQRYLADLEGVLGRNVPVLLLAGERDKHHSSFLAALDGRLGEVLAANPHLVTIETTDAELHGELRLESQAFTRERVSRFVAWLLTGS